MKLPALIPDRQDAIVALCQRTGIRRPDLFGSAVRSDCYPLHSDQDFVVVLDDQPAVDYSNRARTSAPIRPMRSCVPPSSASS